MESNSQMRIKGSDGINRVIANDGTILSSDNKSENFKKVQQIRFGNQQNEDEAPLMPLPFYPNHRQEAMTGETVYQSNEAEAPNATDEILLPAGLQLNSDGSISDKEAEHIQTLKKQGKDQNKESVTPDDDNILMPIINE